MRFLFAIVLSASILAGLTSAPAAAVPKANDQATCAKAKGDDAIAACGQLIESGKMQNGELARIYLNRCYAWNWMREADKAMADCNEAVRLDPKFAGGYNGRCWSWNLKNDPDRAILDCNEAIRLNENLAGAFNNRGESWRQKGDQDRAIADYTQAIRIDPKFVSAYTNRCAAWNSKRNPDRGMPDCQRGPPPRSEIRACIRHSLSLQSAIALSASRIRFQA